MEKTLNNFTRRDPQLPISHNVTKICKKQHKINEKSGNICSKTFCIVEDAEFS